ELKPRAIVSAQPHEALVVDMDAVLPFDPFITIARATPGLDEIARRIEHDDRRRSHLGLIGFERPRTVQDPGIALCIDGNAGHITELPLCWHLRQRWVLLEVRYVAGCRIGVLSYSLCV